mgnify:CR=1 FL=1
MADEKAKIVTDATGPDSGPVPAQPEAAAQVPKQEQSTPEVPAPDKAEAPAQKRSHNLTRVLRRGIEAAEDHCLLSAAAINLKRMIKYAE